MALDLETLRNEMQTCLDEAGVPVFYGTYRVLDSLNQVAWDVENHPDFREFLAIARRVGARIIVFNHQAFSLEQIDDALEQLEAESAVLVSSSFVLHETAVLLQARSGLAAVRRLHEGIEPSA